MLDPSFLKRLVLRPGPKVELAPGLLGAGTERTHRTRPTVSGLKMREDILFVLDWARLLPPDGVFAPGTLHPFLLPVNRNLVQGKGPGLVCLPPRVWASGAYQANPVVPLT